MYVVAAVFVAAAALLLLSSASDAVHRGVSGAGLITGGLAVTAACVYRFRHSSGRRRRAWALFMLAGLLGATGNSFLLYITISTDGLEQQSDVSNACLISSLLACVAGLVVYPSAARRGTELTRMVLDGVVIGGSILFAASVTVFPSVLSGASLSGSAVLLLPPVFDVVFATVGALLFLRAAQADRPFLGLTSAGFAAYALSDFSFAVQAATNSVRLGTVADLGWIAGYVLIALGLIQAKAPAPASESPRELSPVLGTILTFCLFLGAAVLSLTNLRAGHVNTTAAVLWLSVLLAVAGRQIFLIIDNEKLRGILEQRVIQRSSELRQVTQQSDLLVNSVGDGIYGVDRDGVITFANPAAAEALNYTPEQLIGQQAHAMFHAPHPDGAPYPLDFCYVTEAIRDRIVTSAEEDVYTRADGVSIPVEVTATPLTEDDEVRGAVVVFRDVTQRREMDRLKNEFVSMVSHELRTPLTSIRGSLGLLAGGALGDLAPRAVRMVKIALESSERLTRLINAILDIERIEAGVMPINRANHHISDLIRAAVEQVHVLGQEAGVTLHVLEARGEVLADADWVAQTMLNLLGNAIKFSPYGSRVDIASTETDGYVEVSISDHGRGVPDDKLEAIFARFQQIDSSDARHNDGSGLGLAISRSLVERSGGRIWAENNAAGGATFRFTLPQASNRTPPPPDAGHTSTLENELRAQFVTARDRAAAPPGEPIPVEL